MTRLVDDLAQIELPPDEPTLEAVEEEFGREITAILNSPDDEDENYNRLTDKLKYLSIKKKIEIIELPLDPMSKSFPHVLRAQAMLVQGTENNVVRADESVMRRQEAASLLPLLLQQLKEEQEALKKVSFRRTIE